jgi:protein involved in polysaccharide export with SLBB domain
VYVWGAVSQPGIWKIEPGTGLVELFSVVRPTGFGTESPRTRKDIVIRIRRSTGGVSRVAHELELEDLLDMPPDERPSLQPEDILEVRTVEKRGFSFRTFSTIVGTLSSVTLLIIRVSNV